MGLDIVRIQVVAVVGGNNRYALAPAQFEKAVVDCGLLLYAVVLQFEIEVAVKEFRAVAGKVCRDIHALRENGLGDLALQAGREAGDALGVGRDYVPVYPGLVEKALLPAGSDNLEQIVESLFVARKKDQVVAAPCRVGCGVKAVWRHVDFAAEDGLQAIFPAGLLKLASAEHIAVVRDGAGGHAKILGPGAQILEPDGAVEHAVFGMAVKVDKIGHIVTDSADRSL